jgi:hypothetical protein
MIGDSKAGHTSRFVAASPCFHPSLVHTASSRFGLSLRVLNHGAITSVWPTTPALVAALIIDAK